MASSEGGQKRKRAWRKPREAIGPGVVETVSSEKKPSLTRIRRGDSRGENEGTTPPSETMDTTAATPEEQSRLTEVKVYGDGVVARNEKKLRKEETAGGSDGASSKTPTSSGGSDVASSSETPPSTSTVPVEIDGSVLEGGGQILRNAMALSCLLRQPIYIKRIRAGRTTPGLRPQHLTGIQLLSELCGGRLEGDFPGSSDVTFHPNVIAGGGTFTADTKTAGSVCLLLQASLPSLLFAARPTTVILKGGTNADMAPPIDYTTKVFQPIAAKFGVHFDCQLKRRGFFPKGRGEVVVTPAPLKQLTAVTLTDPGQLTSLKIHAFVAGAVRPQVSHQMVDAARRVLERQLPGVPIEVNKVQETQQTAFGNSSGIFILAQSSTGCLFAGSSNGRKTEAPDRTAKTAADELVRNVKAGGCVDEHLQDQLIILMALAKGRSVVRSGTITLHTKTAIHLAEMMTSAKFSIEKLESKGKEEINLISCDGIGLVNKMLT